MFLSLTSRTGLRPILLLIATITLTSQTQATFGQIGSSLSSFEPRTADQTGSVAAQVRQTVDVESARVSPEKKLPSAITEEPRELSAFFIVGIIINLTMFTAFAIWAVGQWRKTGKK